MKTLEFAPSETFFGKKRRLFLMSKILAPIPVLLVIFFTTNFAAKSLNFKITFAVAIISILIILLHRQQKSALAQLRKNQLHLSDNTIILIEKDNRTEIPFTNLRQLIIQNDAKNNVTAIYLTTPDKTIKISGYAQMNTIAENLSSVIDTDKIFKSESIDWDISDPCFFLPVFVGISIILLAIIRMNHFAMISIVYILLTFIGIGLLSLRPLTLYKGIKYFKYEIFTGIALILIGSGFLIMRSFSLL